MVDFTRRRLFIADDWGFSPGINDGVLQMAQQGWLAGVSCAANARFLTHGLDKLLASGTGGVQFSLHFNLTYGRPLLGANTVPSLCTGESFASHYELMRRCLFRQVEPAEVAAEFRAQLFRLRETGLKIACLDGHHHVHLLPAVARALRGELSAQGISQIRVLNDRDHFWSWLQTKYFKLFINSHSPLTQLECCYLRPKDLRAKNKFARKLRRSGSRLLLIHPALYDDFQSVGMTDNLREYRVREFKMITEYLND